MGKYDYLKAHVDLIERKAGENSFYSIALSEIENSEKELKLIFPSALKEFWLEVGFGFFRATTPEKNIKQRDWSNRLLPPEDIASIVLEGVDSGLITPEGLEILQEGHMPFFEVGDATSYLTMIPQSQNPNAVYYFDSLIEDSFETFIWKLYHESPIYYLNKM